MDIRIDFSGFEEREKLRFEGSGVRNVHKMFGEAMAMVSKVTLNMMFLNVGKMKRQMTLEEAEVAYKNLASLARTDIFNINGVNYLKRYIQAFEGYCEGVGISFAEGAVLQIVEEVGCQTLMVQDKATKEVRMIHTEEDTSFFDATKMKNSDYFYRLVEMVIDGKEITFFAYPSLCSWGPAFGVNKTAGMIQAVDDLYIKEVHSRGVLWANAVGFMVLDAGDMEIIRELVRRISLLPGEKFTGGYAIHFMKSGEAFPRARSIEFGGDKIAWVKPVEVEDRTIAAQSNYAKNKTVQKYSITFPPGEGERWSQEDAELYVEMRERMYRLEKMGLAPEWLGRTADESIRVGLEMLARPEGDIGRSWTDEGRPRYYYTGLPSKWVAGHMVAYMGKDEIVCRMAKALPRPIRGKEYAVGFKRNYKYAKNKLWEMAEKERRIRYKKPIVYVDTKKTETGQ